MVVEEGAVVAVVAVAHASSVGRKVTGHETALTQAQVGVEEGVGGEVLGDEAHKGTEGAMVVEAQGEEGEGEGLPALAPVINVASQDTGLALAQTNQFQHDGVTATGRLFCMQSQCVQQQVNLQVFLIYCLGLYSTH